MKAKRKLCRALLACREALWRTKPAVRMYANLDDAEAHGAALAQADEMIGEEGRNEPLHLA